jgi:CheY-like chemotaxis protein/HPt (histidine-containing phosphotransfer) domain-containing protein
LPLPLAATAAGKLRGRVLLVEDNPINQGLAQAMLARLGVECEVACDGAEGVERVRVADFDLILMDCQMPVMDGYQATAAIRALPDGRGAKLPIVALTANAMHGDEQVCLNAGMNGFLAKPYTLAALRATLSGWLALEVAPAAAAPALPPAPLPAGREPSAIDLAAIETLRDLDSGNTELVTRLVTSFLDAADGRLAQVAIAADEGDARTVSQVAHSMKSSAANLGALVLAGCYRELEKCGREGRTDDARGLIEQARHEQHRAVQQLRALLVDAA